MSEHQEGKSTWAVLATGLAYVLLAWHAPHVFRILGTSYAINAAYLGEHGVRYSLTFVVLALPVLGLVCVALLSESHSPVRAAVTGESLGTLIQAVILGGLVFWIMDAFGIWPWIWRWRASAFGFGRNVLLMDAWAAFAVLLVVFGLLFPLVEELVFRFGALKVIARLTGSSTTAVVLSSLLFSVAHFGPAFRPTAYDLAHGIGLFAFGVVLGVITQKRKGRIGLAVAIHGGRNLAEQLALVFVLVQ